MDLTGQWDYLEKIANHRLANNKTPDHVYKYGTTNRTYLVPLGNWRHVDFSAYRKSFTSTSTAGPISSGGD